jgi:hypothetical protein
MSKVKLQPTESGALFTASKNNPEYGYIQVRQSTLKNSVGRWAETEERSALILGTIPALRTIITEAKGGVVPDKIHNEIMGKRTDEEAAYKRYFKRAGKDGIFLTKDGERIVRYAFWDKSGEVEDIICAHDNGDAIREARAAAAEKQAELPAAAPATRKRATLPA